MGRKPAGHFSAVLQPSTQLASPVSSQPQRSNLPGDVLDIVTISHPLHRPYTPPRHPPWGEGFDSMSWFSLAGGLECLIDFFQSVLSKDLTGSKLPGH